MQKGLTEKSITVQFDVSLQNLIYAKIPLTSPTKLGNIGFQVPFSIVFGEDDFMNPIDHGASRDLINSKRLGGQN